MTSFFSSSTEIKVSILEKIRNAIPGAVIIPLTKNGSASAGKKNFLPPRGWGDGEVIEIYKSTSLDKWFAWLDTGAKIGAALVAGKCSGITIIDFDKMEAMKELEEYASAPIDKLCSFITTSQSGNKHLVYEYTDEFSSQIKKAELGFDILSDGKLDFSIPINPGYKTHTAIDELKLEPMPEIVKEFLRSKINQKKEKLPSLSLFEERKRFYINPNVIQLKDAIQFCLDKKHSAGYAEANCNDFITSEIEELFIRRLFKGKKVEYKNRMREGNRHSKTISLLSVFKEDPTISREFFDNECVEFLKDFIGCEEDINKMIASGDRNFYYDDFVYEDSFEKTRREYFELHNSGVDDVRKTEKYIEMSSLLQDFYANGVLLGRNAETGHYFKFNLETGKISEFKLNSVDMKTFLSQKTIYDEKINDPKNDIPVVERFVYLRERSPGYCFVGKDFVFNAYVDTCKYQKLWDEKFNGKEVDPLSFDDLDEPTKKLFTNCFAEKDDVDHYYRSIAYHLSHPWDYPKKLYCIIGGQQGTGKSIVATKLGEVLFGETGEFAKISEKDYRSSFNDLLKNKRWVSFDDTNGLASSLASEVKNFIDVKTLNIREKFKSAAVAQNVAFYTLTSNDIAPFQVEEEARRFVIYKGVEGEENKLDIDKLFGLQCDVGKVIEDNIEKLFRILRTLEVKYPEFSPYDAYNVENLKELSSICEKDPLGNLVNATLNYAEHPTEENFEHLKDVGGWGGLVDKEAYVDLVKSLVDSRDYTLTAEDVRPLLLPGKWLLLRAVFVRKSGRGHIHYSKKYKCTKMAVKMLRKNQTLEVDEEKEPFDSKKVILPRKKKSGKVL